MLEEPLFMERIGWQHLLRDGLKAPAADAADQWRGWWAFEWMQLWVEVLRDRYLKDHPEEREAWLQWQEKNRRLDNRSTSGYRRRDIPVSLSKDLMERDAYRYQQCSSSKELTIDHIDPVPRGGANHPSNLRVLCKSCNSRKGSQL
jgi:hypothetical protein